jgi:hypothetical protein
MTFEIPSDRIPEGLSYEWKRWSVMGDHDPSDLASLRQRGWEPVSPKDQPSLVSPEHHGPHIISGGMILMQRPIELTEKAKEESRKLFLDTMATLKRILDGEGEGFSDFRYKTESDRLWLDKILNVDDATEEDGGSGTVIITVPARVHLSFDQQDAAQVTYPGVSKTKAHVAYARELVQMQMNRLDLYSTLLKALLSVRS